MTCSQQPVMFTTVASTCLLINEPSHTCSGCAVVRVYANRNVAQQLAAEGRHPRAMYAMHAVFPG